MVISDKLGNSHVEAMDKIVSFITSFDVQKLLYAIGAKKLDEDDISSITLDIKEQNIKLERQKKHLFHFGKVYNKEFTTSDNKCFDTSAHLLFKMRSGIKGIKIAVKSFHRRSRKKPPFGKEAPQVIDKSLISANVEYMEDLFGLDSYPLCVKDLFAAMICFYNNMMECLHEALRVLSEEKATRQDEKKCLELLIQAFEKCHKDQLFIINAMNNNPALKAAILDADEFKPTEKNPVLKEWFDKQNDECGFASLRFHNCTPEDISKISFYKTIMEAEGNPDLISCMTIFSCDREKAEAILTAIRHFDDMLPDKCKRKHIPSIYLHVFMRWCSEGVGYETFLNYFNKRYIEAGGKWKSIGKSALSGASRKDALNSSEYEKIKKRMHTELNKFTN